MNTCYINREVNFVKESDLFPYVKEWLLNEVGCSEVFGEVLNCDVLGLCSSVDIIVEMKTSLNFKVMEQAHERKSKGHYVYIAVPQPKQNHSYYQINLLKQEGIGLIYVNVDGRIPITVVVKPKINRHLNRRYSIRKDIKEYHKTQIGGVKSGETVTDYSVTIRNIKEFLYQMSYRKKKSDGWVTVVEILEGCETHYANPKASVQSTLQAHWNSDWCETKIENRKRYFRLKKDASEVRGFNML